MAGPTASETPASRTAKVAIIDAMGPHFATALAVVSLMGLLGFSASASPFPRRDSEEKLQARIERERHPVKRAKFKVRLGRVKLLKAVNAYDQGNLDQCQELLDAYLGEMKSAWTDLQDSGRQAWRKPDGFKQLDIALREDGRFLEDFEHRIPFEQRGPVEKVHQEAEDLRAAVLKALFPPEGPQKERKKFVGGAGRQFLKGALLG